MCPNRVNRARKHVSEDHFIVSEETCIRSGEAYTVSEETCFRSGEAYTVSEGT